MTNAKTIAMLMRYL